MDWSLSLPLLLAGLSVSLMAGVARGASGFGYSAIVVAALSPWVGVSSILPAVLALEAVASVQVFRLMPRPAPSAWSRALMWSNALLVPLGAWSIHILPLNGVKALVAHTLFFSAGCALMLQHKTLRARTAWIWLASGLSAWLNGVAASGGLVAALTMAASGMPARTMRSLMVHYLFQAGLWVLAVLTAIAWWHAPQDWGRWLRQAFSWWLVLLPGMVLGVHWGHRWQARVSDAGLRLAVLRLIFALSLVSLATFWLEITGKPVFLHGSSPI